MWIWIWKALHHSQHEKEYWSSNADFSQQHHFGCAVYMRNITDRVSMCKFALCCCQYRYFDSICWQICIYLCCFGHHSLTKLSMLGIHCNSTFMSRLKNTYLLPCKLAAYFLTSYGNLKMACEKRQDLLFKSEPVYQCVDLNVNKIWVFFY